MANMLQCFFLDFKNILLDEIALDGLQGIGIKMLWDRLEKRLSSTSTPKMKEKYWKFIIDTDSISIYKVPESPPHIEILDRFSIIEEATGYMLDPVDYLDGPYEWCPIENEYGSCSNYNTRALILKHDIQSMKYEEVESNYGDQLVLVASLEERWHALAPHVPFSWLNQLTQIHYGLLELIGKGRENGQMTIGKSNLSKIVKEPKLLFYNRNVLQKLGLVKVQYTTQLVFKKAMKSILLRLKRFHKPILGSLPKIGKIANIVNYLLEKPDHSEVNEIMVKKGFFTPQQSKRLQKAMNIFIYDEREVMVEKNTKNEKQTICVKKKFISLPQNSDDSASSEDEVEELTLKCQHKVGVSIMRQAYERVLEAGLKGLTQTEIAQILGVEFYTSRAICRVFKQKNLVREFLEDKGRQRTARYIAIAATEEIDKEYAAEKNKLLEHLNETTNEQNNSVHSKEGKSDSDNDIPLKKLKLEKDFKITTEERIDTDHKIIELKVLDGLGHVKDSLLNTKKNLTLRQLKYANGVIKVVKEHKFIIGFQTLSMLASKASGEPPMDTKALRLFVQKLMIDNQVKVLKCIRPSRFSFFICDPQIKPTDDIIKKKYKELYAKSELAKKSKKRIAEAAKPLWQFIYQKYIKIQTLHEFITKFVYFNDNKISTSFLPGFTSLLTIISEMTVEFALSNINNIETSDCAEIKLDDHSKSSKIRDTPEEFRNFLLQSKNLQNSIKANLKFLSALGLIQLVHTTQPNRKEGTVNTYVFYVNRNAKIINTSGSWPRPADENALEKTFYFEKFEDVQRYWLDVTNISSNTIINVEKREVYKLIHPLRNEIEVKLFDNGERLGDGLGPCGFDSSLFMDVPRLWRKLVFKSSKLPQPQLFKSKVKRIVKKRVKKPIKPLKKEKVVDKLDIPVKKKMGKRPDAPSVVWSHFEDKILMLCKAAITIMSPVSQPGLLKVRNIAAKDLLTTIDPKKTASCCHKRSLVLESNSVLMYEKDCIINELRRRRHLVKKYEGLLRVLRLRHYGYISRYIKQARLPMLELVWLVSQIERTKPYIQRVPCIAINFDDFNKKYTITPTTANQSCNVYRTPITSEPENAALKEGIIISVMLSVKKPVTKETAQTIFKIFEAYPETKLRNAVEHLRKAGAISAREKIVNNNFNKVHFDDIVQSAYKISAAYRRKWLNRLESEFADNLANMLDSTIPEKSLKGSCELNCFLFEMNICEILDITSDTIPVVIGSAGSLIQEEQMNVIDMETKYKLKSGLIGWKAKRNLEVFSELYKNIDFKPFLDNILKESVLNFPDSYDVQNEIILYLEGRNTNGSTFSDLQNHFGMDRKVLCEKLRDLEANKFIKRVGFYENLIVLTKYAIPLSFKIDSNLYIIPTPWLTLEANLHLEVFVKWTSVVMNKIFESPGCSIDFLSNNFECITTRSVQDICTFLEGCECVRLHCIEKKSVDLFSENDDVLDLTEYNPYDSPDRIVVFPVKNSLTKYSYIRKLMLGETETSY